MKKMVIGLLAVSVLLSVTACGLDKNENADTSDPEVSEVSDTGITTADGSEITEVKERGLVFKISQEYKEKGVVLEGYNENLEGYPIVSVTYYSKTASDALDQVINMEPEKRTQEVSDEYTQKIWDTSRCILAIVMVETAKYKELTSAGTTLDQITGYSPSEKLGENDGYTYIACIPDLDYGQLSEEEIKEYEECKAYMNTVKDNLTFIPVELENTDTDVGKYMPVFNTVDLIGNTVTSDIFTENKLTVVNLWGTFCSPCIEEMPELEAWSKELPDGVKIIGIVGDIEGEDDAEHLDLAKDIVEKSGVTFQNLIVNDEFSEFMDGIIGFPTTLFVDQTGAVAGDPIVGSDMEAYKQFVEEYINENSK